MKRGVLLVIAILPVLGCLEPSGTSGGENDALDDTGAQIGSDGPGEAVPDEGETSEVSPDEGDSRPTPVGPAGTIVYVEVRNDMNETLGVDVLDLDWNVLHEFTIPAGVSYPNEIVDCPVREMEDLGSYVHRLNDGESQVGMADLVPAVCDGRGIVLDIHAYECRPYPFNDCRYEVRVLDPETGEDISYRPPDT